jgi:hypothetical protein
LNSGQGTKRKYNQSKKAILLTPKSILNQMKGMPTALFNLMMTSYKNSKNRRGAKVLDVSKSIETLNNDSESPFTEVILQEYVYYYYSFHNQNKRNSDLPDFSTNKILCDTLIHCGLGSFGKVTKANRDKALERLFTSDMYFSF